MSSLYKENTTYWSEPSQNGRIWYSKLRAVAQKNVDSLVSASNAKSSRAWIPANLQSLMISEPVSDTPSDQVTFPVNQPIADQFSGKYKSLQQYRKQSWEAMATQTDQPWYTAETPTTKIANMPSFLGAWEYLTDPNSANVANTRVYVPAENKAILWNRDPRLYQVDHIIPLWAGWADTIANKQILTIADHEIKSKIQSVPFTLMAKWLITPQQAKVAAINWRDEDATWIPEEWASGGFINEKLAQEKFSEWQRTKPVTFKDVLKQVPEVLKSVTRPLAAKTWEDSTEQFFKSMAGGFLSEATMWALPYQSDSTDASSKIWWYVGKIWGNLVSFAWLWWLLGETAKIASKAKFLKSFANSAKIADETFKWAQLTREWAQVADTAAWIVWNSIPIAVKWAGVWDAIASASKNWLNNIIKKVKINSVLKTAWLMNAYGQIRMTVPAAVWLQKMPNINQRVQQAMVDTAYGWLLGQAGHTIPWYAGVWAGAFTIWLISWDDVEDSALDAFTMMALHWLWQRDANKKAKLPTLEEAMNRVADKTASDHIFDKTWIRIEKLNPDSAINIREKLNAERDKLVAKWDVDINEIAKTRLQDEVAIRQLEKGWMTTALRRQSDIDDMGSIWDKMRTKEQLQDTSTPDEVVQTVQKMEDHLFNNTPLEKTDWWDISWASQPVGRFPLTGIAEQISWGEPKKRVDYFFNAKDKWLAANNVLLVERSELAPFFEEINRSTQTLKSKQIRNNDASLMKHPENSVQAFWVVKVDNANTVPLPWVVRVKWSDSPLDIVPLWWVARQDRIASVSEWGRNKSFNQNTLDRFWENAWADMLDPKNNKDLIAESARANWVKVLTASLNPISTPRGKTTQQPFIVVDINPDNWSNSIELNKQRIWQSTWDNIETLVTKATKNNDPQAVVNVINKIKERNPDTGAAKVMKTMAIKSKDPDTAFASDVLETFEKWLKSWSAQKLKEDVNKKYWEVLDDNTSLQLMTNKDNFTAENAFDILYDWIEEWGANVGTSIMYKNNLMPLFKKINSNSITIDWIPVNSFYHKMPVLSNDSLGHIGESKETGEWTEKNYEKYNTFDSEKKRQELELLKREWTEIIENFDIHWHETDSNILWRMKWQIDNLVDSYKWSNSEKQQAKDLLMDYAKDKVSSQKADSWEFVDNFDDIAINPKKWLNKNTKSVEPTTLTSIYPDIYKADERNNPLANKIAWKMSLQQLMERASKTNKNSLANDIQSSASKSEAEWKKNTALLWNDVLKEFDRLWSSSDWRNKEIDSSKFNENMKKISNDTITSWPKAGSSKTVNPEIANYEMDINIGRIDDLPEPIKEKYKELQKEWYWHVYSSSTMGSNAYKWKTSADSSINMFKYIKEYAEKNDDAHLVKEIYWDKKEDAEKALEAIKTWRLWDELTTGRLASIEKEMYWDKAPDIAKKLEERKIDLNKWASPEMIEAWLSPISIEDFKENPEFNTPLSHAIMSLSKYKIEDLTPEEINKLAKSLSFTLWPSVKYSLKSEPVRGGIKKINTKQDGKWWKEDWQWWLWDSLWQVLFNWAQDFSNKTNIQKIQDSAPKIDRTKTILGKYLNLQPKVQTTIPTIKTTQNNVNTGSINQNLTPNLTPKINPAPIDKNQLGHIVSMVESSGWKNKTNQFNDQWKYWYVVWFTKWTYNWIAKRASQWDTRYIDLLNKLNFDTPETAKQSAIEYMNFRNILFDKNWRAVGTKYSSPEDIYVNLYNASGTQGKKAARKNWKNVIKTVQWFNK